MDIKCTILSIIKKNQDIFPESMLYYVQNDSHKDVLDSLNFIRLVVLIEDEFGIEFDDSMLNYNEFADYDLLINYISKLINDKNRDENNAQNQ